MTFNELSRFVRPDGVAVKRIFFPNGLGIDFVGGSPYGYGGIYGDGVATWEAAEFRYAPAFERETEGLHDDVYQASNLIYDHTGGDVLGYLTIDECDTLIKCIRQDKEYPCEL